MSMYKQLWLAIIASMLLALTGSLLAALLSARGYLEEQLSIKNGDNATALALSLSQQQVDPIIVELAVAALFDSGHDESIEVFDPAGALVAGRSTADAAPPVPGWFVQALPIVAQLGEALITSGWAQFGTVLMRSTSSFAYQALWRSAIEMTLAALLAGIVGGFLGSRILGRLRRPLQQVIDQAQAITDRRFMTVAEPAVPELSHLAGAMNSMVVRLRTMFDEEAKKLEQVRLEANTDPLTGLANRSFVLARLRSLLEGEDSSGGGFMLVRVADLNGINRRLGREATDELLRITGTVLQDFVAQRDGIAGRLNGADFAVLVSGPVRLRALVEPLLAALVRATEPVAGQIALCVGFGMFPRGLELSAVLAQVDVALAAAEAEGGTTFREAQLSTDLAPRSAEEWARLLDAAISARRLRLVSFPVAATGGGILHHECPLRMQLEEGGEWLPAGNFLPMAERLRLTARLDREAVRLGLQMLAGDTALPGVAINLSASSFADAAFLPDLASLLQTHAGEAPRFWLEVAEAGALRHFDALKALAALVKKGGAHIGIEHLGRQFSQVGVFQQLGLDYFKVDASFIREVQLNAGNRSFLQGLTLIAKGIGVLVIAEGVASTAELQTLQEIGFDGATGPAIR